MLKAPKAFSELSCNPSEGQDFTVCRYICRIMKSYMLYTAFMQCCKKKEEVIWIQLLESISSDVLAVLTNNQSAIQSEIP